MRFLFFMIKFMPYWAIPTALIFFEMGLVLKRRGNHHLFVRLTAVSVLMVILTICFFIFRWDTTLYPFLRDRLAV